MAKRWTLEETEYLIQHYATTKIQVMCKHLGFSAGRIHDKANMLGLKKTKFFTTVNEKSKLTQFKPGNKVWNKGLKLGPEWGKWTHFEKGRIPHNKLPDDLKEASLLRIKLQKIINERLKRYDKKQNSGFA